LKIRVFLTLAGAISAATLLHPRPPAAAQVVDAPVGLPRMADGKPNLSGIWQAMNTAAWDIQDHSPSLGVPAGIGVVEGNEIPYRPEALKKRQENYAKRDTTDPETKCNLPGVPRITYMPYPFQIFQTQNHVAIAYEYVHADRVIYTDGTDHPKGHIDWWMGDSRGHWEGDALIVDVIDFNDQTWFDRAGNFHSEALHVVERYTPVGRDVMTYEVTIEDPKVFTRPWKMSMPLYRHQEKIFRILEYECFTYTLQAQERDKR
jgi:hypothetical protein